MENSNNQNFFMETRSNEAEKSLLETKNQTKFQISNR